MQRLLHRRGVTARHGHSLPKRKLQRRDPEQAEPIGGRITGTWEERTFNATGNAVGQASGDKISLQISGGVSGTMLVSYSGSRQSVAISTQGIALKSVTISLSRS